MVKFTGHHYLLSTAEALCFPASSAHQSNATLQAKEGKHFTNRSHTWQVGGCKSQESIKTSGCSPLQLLFLFLHYQSMTTAIKLCSNTSWVIRFEVKPVKFNEMEHMLKESLRHLLTGCELWQTCPSFKPACPYFASNPPAVYLLSASIHVTAISSTHVYRNTCNFSVHKALEFLYLIVTMTP